MLALLGVVTILLLLGLIVSGRTSPVALAGVPVVASLAAGFGLETSKFVVSGLQQTAPVAAMFVFAIL